MVGPCRCHLWGNVQILEMMIHDDGINKIRSEGADGVSFSESESGDAATTTSGHTLEIPMVIRNGSVLSTTPHEYHVTVTDSVGSNDGTGIEDRKNHAQSSVERECWGCRRRYHPGSHRDTSLTTPESISSTTIPLTLSEKERITHDSLISLDTVMISGQRVTDASATRIVLARAHRKHRSRRWRRKQNQR